MSEEDIKRIEKKVNLLYKILLELYVDYIGHPYDQKYIDKFMDELVPLFELSAEEIEIERLPTQKEINELRSGLETELSRLEKIYKSGDFLSKDAGKIRGKIEEITDHLGSWEEDWDSSGVVAGIFKDKEEITNRNKEIYEKSLFVDLKKKLGLGVGDAYISYIGEYGEDGKVINIIERRDALKKNTEDFIEKIRNLGKVNN